MADDDHSATYRSSPSAPAAWMPNAHIYPHSHHGTPAQEYSGFSFASSPQIRMEPSAFNSGGIQQRPLHHQLQPLITMQQPMPQWPSMLSSQQHAPFQPPIYSQAVQPLQPMAIGALPTPVSATSVRSASTPRRTLTDTDRKRMCQYAEDHPNSKQTEIGAIFGVERSTVSKVLRQKEKYLYQDDGSRSPIKRAKGRSPDIERALAVWAKNQEKKGAHLTDELIREKARAFAATTTTPDNHVTLSASWLEKFKLKNNLMGARSRKTSLAMDDADSVSAILSSSQTPRTSSPVSNGLGSPSPSELRSAPSQSSLKHESPDGYIDFNNQRHDPFHTQSSNSLNSAFTDRAPSSFSPGPISPTSPFFTPDSGTAPSPFMPPGARQAQMQPQPPPPASISTNAIRPRSQTFPLLDQYMLATASENVTPRYAGPVLDSPMEEPTDPLVSLDHTLHACAPAPDDRSVSISSMRPPPLPAHLVQQHSAAHLTSSSHPEANHDGDRSFSQSTNGTRASPRLGGAKPSPEEARQALAVVLSFFEQQPTGYLDLQESITIGKLMEKLKLQSRGSMSGASV